MQKDVRLARRSDLDPPCIQIAGLCNEPRAGVSVRVVPVQALLAGSMVSRAHALAQRSLVATLQRPKGGCYFANRKHPNRSIRRRP